MALLAVEPLFIFPFNGNGLEAIDCLGDGFRLVAFIDDNPEKHGRSKSGYDVLSRDALLQAPTSRVLAVPGSPTSYLSRRLAIHSLGIADERYACIIHSTARVSPLATLGTNILLMAGVVVTSNAILGSHVCVLPNTVIHHDTVIGDFTLIGSSVTIAGSVTVGENCYIGSGTTLMNGIDVGDGALIGLGSNVIRNVPPGARVAGNPARRL